MTNKENLFLNTFQFPRKVADRIENTSRDLLLKDRDRWFLPDCAHPIGHPLQKDLNPYYSCTLINEHKSKIEFWKQFDLEFFNRYIRLQKNRMIRAHITLHDPNPEKFGIPHNYHIDQQFPHIVALYYVNDADGDTIFCDEHDHSKIIHRETPKRGKCVIFEGLHAYHASSSPTKNIRMTLNINYDHI